jgi:integrase
MLASRPNRAIDGRGTSTPQGSQPCRLLHKTPILTPNEARRLIRSIPTDTLVGLRDRALIGLMIYTFARVSAAVAMNVKDVYQKQESLWVRLHEKGGKHHEMPCQHNLKDWLREYIEAAGIAEDKDGPLFRTVDRKSKALGSTRLDRQRAWAMVKRRTQQAGIETDGICNHTFGGTGITAYLEPRSQAGARPADGRALGPEDHAAL